MACDVNRHTEYKIQHYSVTVLTKIGKIQTHMAFNAVKLCEEMLR